MRSAQPLEAHDLINDEGCDRKSNGDAAVDGQRRESVSVFLSLPRGYRTIHLIG